MTRGRTTRFLTLDGRELARLRGYSASTSTMPLLQKGLGTWTLRNGRVVRAELRWNLRVRGHGDGCALLGRLGSAELLICSGRAGAEPLLVRGQGGRARPLVPALRDNAGHWVNAFVSPGGERLLLTWGSECEVPTAFLAPAGGGRPQAVTGEGDWRKAPESLALGWTRDGRALVHLMGGLCGTGKPRPGVYAFEGPGEPTFIVGPVDSAAFFPRR